MDLDSQGGPEKPLKIEHSMIDMKCRCQLILCNSTNVPIEADRIEDGIMCMFYYMIQSNEMMMVVVLCCCPGQLCVFTLKALSFFRSSSLNERCSDICTSV